MGEPQVLISGEGIVEILGESLRILVFIIILHS